MTIGNKRLNQVDPERQMEIVRKHLLGEKTPDNVVLLARFAIKEAGKPVQNENVNEGHTYTEDELSEIESRLDRLEMLIIRKRSGEIITSEEIDRASIQEEEAVTTEIPEPDKFITKIGKIITYAKILLTTKPEVMIDSKKEGRKEIEKAKEMIDQAKMNGIDVKAQEKRLSDFIQKHSDILQST